MLSEERRRGEFRVRLNECICTQMTLTIAGVSGIIPPSSSEQVDSNAPYMTKYSTRTYLYISGL